ncbi:MAG: aldo/keto reductase, partial [Anaerolineales bacterium]|nr:aldo/keto reductase [Anaerolineales bacterium]
GCWAIGGPFFLNGIPDGWGNVDDDESIRAIHCALDLGVNFFDTADAYGTGHSEHVLAKALAGRRGQVVLATKFGFTYNEATKELLGTDVSPDYIRWACTQSLKRLDTDYIDLYQLHCGATPTETEAVLDTLDELVAAGKIRSYAWSTDDPAAAALFAARPNCTAVQHELNLFNPNPNMLALCKAENLASVNRTPLAFGLLTGKFDAATKISKDDFRGAGHEWVRYFADGRPKPEFLDMLANLREILTSDGRSLVQGALGWLWALSDKTIPIPGFKTVNQVAENCAAMQHGPLNADQMAQIETILPN